MNMFNEYQEKSMRTRKDHSAGATMDKEQLELLEGALGLGGEAGEVVDIVKKAIFHKHSVDKEEIAKELGDVMWYIALMSEAIGIPMEEIAARNYAKLAKRYPEGFDSSKSAARYKKIVILEGMDGTYKTTVGKHLDLIRDDVVYTKCTNEGSWDANMKAAREVCERIEEGPDNKVYVIDRFNAISDRYFNIPTKAQSEEATEILQKLASLGALSIYYLDIVDKATYMERVVNNNPDAQENYTAQNFDEIYTRSINTIIDCHCGNIKIRSLDTTVMNSAQISDLIEIHLGGRR